MDLFLFTEAVDVVIDGVFNDLDRVVTGADLVNRRGLILQIFINREEVAHFVKDVSRQLVDVGVHIVIGIVEGNGNDLFIIMPVIDHGDHTDGIGAYQCQRLQRFGADEQHVQRVTVIAVGTGNKAVVGGIVGGGIQDTVQHQIARFLIQFIFILTALGNLHNAKEIIGCDALGRNVVPNIRHKNHLFIFSYILSQFSQKINRLSNDFIDKRGALGRGGFDGQGGKVALGGTSLHRCAVGIKGAQ